MQHSLKKKSINAEGYFPPEKEKKREKQMQWTAQAALHPRFLKAVFIWTYTSLGKYKKILNVLSKYIAYL